METPKFVVGNEGRFDIVKVQSIQSSFPPTFLFVVGTLIFVDLFQITNNIYPRNPESVSSH